MTDELVATQELLKKCSKGRSNLLPILQKVQKELGYLPREAMQEVAQFLEIPAVDVYGVVTFYNQFRLNPPGKHSIRVCLGTACHMKGGYITLDAWKRRLKHRRRADHPRPRVRPGHRGLRRLLHHGAGDRGRRQAGGSGGPHPG